jgi:glycine betaine/proline transport system substrate-binding protein
MKRIVISMVLGTLLVFLIFSSLSAADSQRIKVAYVDSKESIAKTYMFKYILEDMVGLKVDLYKVSMKEMWKGLAGGRYDASLSVVLPEQKTYYAKYRNRVIDLGPNFMDQKKKVLTVTRLGILDTRPRLAKFLRHYCL